MFSPLHCEFFRLGWKPTLTPTEYQTRIACYYFLMTYFCNCAHEFFTTGLTLSSTCSGLRRAWFYEQVWSRPAWGITFYTCSFCHYADTGLYVERGSKPSAMIGQVISAGYNAVNNIGRAIDYVDTNGDLTKLGTPRPTRDKKPRFDSLKRRQATYLDPRRYAVCLSDDLLPPLHNPAMTSFTDPYRVYCAVLRYLARTPSSHFPTLGRLRAVSKGTATVLNARLGLDGSRQLLHHIQVLRRTASKTSPAYRPPSVHVHLGVLASGLRVHKRHFDSLEYCRHMVADLMRALGIQQYRQLIWDLDAPAFAGNEWMYH